MIESFVLDTISVFELQSDPNQRWLYVWQGRDQNEGQVLVINTQNPSRRVQLPDKDVDKIRWVLGVAYEPVRNRLYVTTTFEDYGENTVYDATTFARVDSFPQNLVVFDYNDDFSEDGQFCFGGTRDESTDQTYLTTISLVTKSIVKSKRRFDLGPPTERKIGFDRKRGISLTGYNYPSRDAVDGHFLIYNRLADKVLSTIPYPRISGAYLSADAKYVMIEDTPVNPDPSPSAPSHLHPGIVYIFQAETGKLTQRLVLPSGGKIMVFNNYPDRFFYYLEGDGIPRSVSIDVTTITPTNVFLDTLLALTHQAFTTNQLGDRRFLQELDRDLQQAKSDLAKNDSIGCAQELEEFQREVKKEYLAKPKKNDKRFVSEEAYKSLYFNALYIIDRVITRPPRSYVPLFDQLTALRAQIRVDAEQGFLGGEILLKGLEAMVDGAKLRLQRQDSLRTALYLTLFRQTVRQTYQLSKNWTIGKLYVKPEGYISLYYRAGYVLEGLPEPAGLLLPKMEPELEQELRRYQRQAEQQE
jgi:hypothetical protein